MRVNQRIPRVAKIPPKESPGFGLRSETAGHPRREQSQCTSLTVVSMTQVGLGEYLCISVMSTPTLRCPCAVMEGGVAKKMAFPGEKPKSLPPEQIPGFLFHC